MVVILDTTNFLPARPAATPPFPTDVFSGVVLEIRACKEGVNLFAVYAPRIGLWSFSLVFLLALLGYFIQPVRPCGGPSLGIAPPGCSTDSWRCGNASLTNWLINSGIGPKRCSALTKNPADESALRFDPEGIQRRSSFLLKLPVSDGRVMESIRVAKRVHVKSPAEMGSVMKPFLQPPLPLTGPIGAHGGEEGLPM